MLKTLVFISLLLSTLSCIGVIASFIYFRNLHRTETATLEKSNASQEQWKTEFTKWRDDISGYVSSLYEKYPTNSSDQQNLPVGIGL